MEFGGGAAEVRDAVVARTDALAARDADALRALLHERFVWTTHRGEVFDRDGYIEANTASQLRWTRQDLEQVAVTVVGDAATVRAVAVDGVERDGREQVFRMPMTQTWVRVENRWRCLAGHAGPLLGDDGDQRSNAAIGGSSGAIRSG